MVALENYLKEKEMKKSMEQQVKEWILESEEKERRKIEKRESMFIKKIPVEIRTCVLEQKHNKRMKIEDKYKSQEKKEQNKTVCVGKNKANNNIKNIEMSCERNVFGFEQTREMNELSENLTEQKMSKREDEKLNNKDKSIARVKNKVDFDLSGDKNKHKIQFVRRYHKPKSYMEILKNKRMMEALNSKKKAKDKKAKKIRIQK